MSSIRVLIASDQASLRQRLREVCELGGGFTALGEAENGREAVVLAHQLQPDVVLMDIEMPLPDGVQAIRSITAQNPSARVIALTAYSREEDVLQAIKAGAQGCLPKDTEESILIEAIRAVHRGEALIDSHVTGAVLDEIRRTGESTIRSGHRKE